MKIIKNNKICPTCSDPCVKVVNGNPYSSLSDTPCFYDGISGFWPGIPRKLGLQMLDTANFLQFISPSLIAANSAIR